MLSKLNQYGPQGGFNRSSHVRPHNSVGRSVFCRDSVTARVYRWCWLSLELTSSRPRRHKGKCALCAKKAATKGCQSLSVIANALHREHTVAHRAKLRASKRVNMWHWSMSTPRTSKKLQSVDARSSLQPFGLACKALFPTLGSASMSSALTSTEQTNLQTLSVSSQLSKGLDSRPRLIPAAVKIGRK